MILLRFPAQSFIFQPLASPGANLALPELLEWQQGGYFLIFLLIPCFVQQFPPLLLAPVPFPPG